MCIVLLPGFTTADIYEKTISENNSYGGVTTKVFYNKGDVNYLSAEGIEEMTIYFDGEGRIKQQEQIYLESNPKDMTDWKVIVFFNENETPIKEEIYTTKKYADYSGVLLEIGYFDDEGKIYRTELYFTNKTQREEGYDLLVIENNVGYIYKKNKLITTIDNVLDSLKDLPGMDVYKH